MDPARLRARAVALRALRSWFEDHGYLEVPTPSRVPSPAMEEHLYAIEAQGAFLRTSPEFALKKVLGSGLTRIYEIGPCWRARESGPWHRTEFTMVEWYRVGASLADLKAEVAAIVAAVASALGRPAPSNWRHATVRELFAEHTGIDLAQATAADLSPEDDGWDDAFFRRWINDVEPRFTGGLFVEQWPASQAALARVRDDGDWPVAERFEVFLDGIELANAFHELIDSNEQRRRFASANAARIATGEDPHPVDEDLIAAVGRMPRTSGIAMGFDRLVSVVMGWPDIG